MSELNILTFSTLYPNNVEKRHGIFVQTRLRHLIKQKPVKAVVLAPVPWFPFNSKFLPHYSKYRNVLPHERNFGIDIHHCRYLVIPKIGMVLTPFFLAISSFLHTRKLIKQGIKIDLIDAHYFYPDGIAAILLGKLFKLPVMITARGTDINLIPNHLLPRKMIQWAFKKSDHMVTVCEALRQEIITLGGEPDKVTTLRNGVDLELFSPPISVDDKRRNLGISGYTVLSVGHLIERKGHHLVIEALTRTQDVTLLIAGDGEEEKKLHKLVTDYELSNRVKFLGALSQTELQDYYGAVDALILASSREGWANVLLESMACGTPVVATNIWGTPEVVQNQQVGILVERNADAIANGIKQILENSPDRKYIREYAEKFDWSSTSEGQFNIMHNLVSN